jgi:hypothetical protein
MTTIASTPWSSRARLGRVLLASALATVAGAACKSDKESLVIVALTATPPAVDLTSVTLTVGSVSRTFSLGGGLTGDPTRLGVYVPSSVSGPTAVTAVATGGASCEYRGNGTVVIASGGGEVTVTVALVPVCTDGGLPDGAGGGSGTGGAGGTVTGAGGGSGTGGAGGTVTGTGGGSGTGGAGGTVTGTGGGTGTGGAGGTVTGTGGGTGTGGRAGTGGAGAATAIPPSLSMCTEYDHNAADNLPCNTETGFGDWGVNSVTFSPDGTLMVSSAQDGRVKIWRFDGKAATPEGHVFTLPRQGYVDFSPDGTLLAAGTRGMILVWTVATWMSRPNIGGITGDIYALAFTPDGQGIVSADSERNLYMHRLDGGAMTRVQNLPSIPYGLDVAPNGQSVAVGFSQGQIAIYAIANGAIDATPTALLQPTMDSIYDVGYSPDGQLLAVPSDDATVRFYATPLTSSSTPSGMSLMPDPDGLQGVNGVAFSPNGRYLAVAAGSLFQGGSGSIWDVAARGQLGGIAQTRYFVLSTAFAPSGTAVVFGEVGCGKVAVCAD